MADDEPTEFLATRRSKRSTAGNRMELALAELGLEDLSKDPEEDRDFHVDKEEEDVFESDFESTDDEAQQVDGEPEKQVQEEEKKEHKTTKSRAERALAAAHERQRATFNPEASKPKEPKKPKAKVKRHVSLGAVVDAETGQVLQGEEPDKTSAAGGRKSKRSHTVLNTSATASRMKLEEQKRASAPKKSKIEAKVYTQDELIARALDNEEGNIVEHRNYLQTEEEKRKRAKVVRATVSGPMLRWVSRAEEEKVKVTVEAPAKTPATPSIIPQTFQMSSYGSGPVLKLSPMSYGQPTTGTVTYGQYQYTTNLPYAQAATQAAQNYASGSATTSYSGYASWLPYQPQPVPQPAATTTETIEKVEKVAKCYVVHELDQKEGTPKPKWKDSMEALFGDHVRWEDMKVYTGKNRPLSRPKHKCPITGRPAVYLDPRSGVPFADVQAFQVLTQVLDHEFVWSPSLGTYIGHEAPDDVQRRKKLDDGFSASGTNSAMDTT
ncbi:hypothetical protein ONZ45_g5533 [Pleurotus djamor]|nr:hypothetical protein ONZ45_g5533 [Pleurotus djamor]